MIEPSSSFLVILSFICNFCDATTPLSYVALAHQRRPPVSNNKQISHGSKQSDMRIWIEYYRRQLFANAV